MDQYLSIHPYLDESLVVYDATFEEHGLFGKDHSRSRGLA
jgi:hypothetical protein